MKYLINNETRYELNCYSENEVQKVSNKTAKEIGIGDGHDDDQGTQWGYFIYDNLEDVIFYLQQEKAHYMNFTVKFNNLSNDEEYAICMALSLWTIPERKIPESKRVQAVGKEN